MATKIKGEAGILYIWDDTIYRPIACLTSNNLATNVSIIESRTKCTPGVVESTGGVFSYTLGFEGEYIDTTSIGGDTTKASHDFMLFKQRTKLAQTWKLDTGATGSVYYGSAIITHLDLSQPAGDEVSTFTGTFTGTGDISTTDPNA